MSKPTVMVMLAVLLPFACAIGFTLLAVEIHQVSPAMARFLLLAAIPCGLTGMTAALVIAWRRSWPT